MRISNGLGLASLFALSISSGVNSDMIVAPGSVITAMQGFNSASLLSGLTLPATVWIVLAGVAALVYLIRHRH